MGEEKHKLTSHQWMKKEELSDVVLPITAPFNLYYLITNKQNTSIGNDVGWYPEGRWGVKDYSWLLDSSYLFSCRACYSLNYLVKQMSKL